jgi:hypothetical protein
MGDARGILSIIMITESVCESRQRKACGCVCVCMCYCAICNLFMRVAYLHCAPPQVLSFMK